MKVTKAWTDWLAVMKKAGEVVSFLQSQEGSDGQSLMLSNVISTARASADGLLMLLRRGEKELAGDNVKPTIQGDLFPATPDDRAVVQSDIRRIVETWFSDTTDHDDEGRQAKSQKSDQGEQDIAPAAVRDVLVALDPNITWPTGEEIVAWKPADRLEVAQWAKQQAAGEEFDLPTVLAAWRGTGGGGESLDYSDSVAVPKVEATETEPSLAVTIKARIFTAGPGGLSDDALFGSFDDDTDIDKLEQTLWALIHTGEVGIQRPELVYKALSPDLVLDVTRMLAEQPDLGTEDGLPEAQIVSYALEASEPAGEGEDIPAAEATFEDAPELVSVVSLYIHRQESVTKGEILEEFTGMGEDESNIVAAVNWLLAQNRIEEQGDKVTVSTDDGLESMDRAQLKAVYLEELGVDAGRKHAGTLIADIRAERAASKVDPPADGETAETCIDGP